MLDVAFTRADIRATDLSVVIDVLRATSTITHALAAGYTRVLCVDTLDDALSLRAGNRLIAGERNGVRPARFDVGNSPLELAEPHSEELVITTTNGSAAITAAARCAEVVLLACALNLDAVVAAVQKRVDPHRASIQLVCAGTDGFPSLEDTYVAGRIAAELSGPRTDAALIAQAVASSHSSAELAVRSGSHASSLAALGFEADLAFCAQTSTVRTVPEVSSVSEGVAVVVDSAIAGLARLVS